MVNLFKISKFAGWIVPIEMFMRGGIVLAIVQSSLYFYYQNFYVQTMAALARDTRLNFLIAKEWVETGDVPHPDITQYIVEKYSENPVHHFPSDEEFMRMQDKILEDSGLATKHKQKRKDFYASNFEKISKFLENKWWIIGVLVADLLQLITVLLFTEYYFYDTVSKQKNLVIAIDSAKSALTLQLRGNYDTINILLTIGWLINLVPTLDSGLKIITKGFSACIRESKGEALKLLSVILLFITSTILVGLNNSLLNTYTFNGLCGLFKTYAFFVAIKLLSILLTVGKKIAILDMLMTVTVKAASLCSALFQMLFIVMLVFGSVGMALFGGNVTSDSPAQYKKNYWRRLEGRI